MSWNLLHRGESRRPRRLRGTKSQKYTVNRPSTSSRRSREGGTGREAATNGGRGWPPSCRRPPEVQERVAVVGVDAGVASQPDLRAESGVIAEFRVVTELDHCRPSVATGACTSRRRRAGTARRPISRDRAGARPGRDGLASDRRVRAGVRLKSSDTSTAVLFDMRRRTWPPVNRTAPVSACASPRTMRSARRCRTPPAPPPGDVHQREQGSARQNRQARRWIAWMPRDPYRDEEGYAEGAAIGRGFSPPRIRYL